MDARTKRVAEAFLARIAGRYPIKEAIVFGSRARRSHRENSDVDLAVILRGLKGKRSAVALDMAATAFDVLLDTGTLVEALPLWEDEIEHPDLFNNPVLIDVIRREGVKV